jgi:hypothetical protein
MKISEPPDPAEKREPFTRWDFALLTLGGVILGCYIASFDPRFAKVVIVSKVGLGLVLLLFAARAIATGKGPNPLALFIVWWPYEDLDGEKYPIQYVSGIIACLICGPLLIYFALKPESPKSAPVAEFPEVKVSGPLQLGSCGNEILTRALLREKRLVNAGYLIDRESQSIVRKDGQPVRCDVLRQDLGK